MFFVFLKIPIEFKEELIILAPLNKKINNNRKTNFVVMKGLNSLRLPNWLIKSIQHGKENDDLGSILVNIGVFYLLGLVAFFVYSPFGSEYIALQIICAVGILLLLAVFCFWLTGQVTLLDSLRKEALVVYKNSKTEEEINQAHLRLKKLWVPIPNAA
jgi:hypothetical protein